MIEKMKVVHIVTTALEKKALLDKLQKMGIVHFSEKAGADQPLLQRFSDLSRMALVLWNRRFCPMTNLKNSSANCPPVWIAKKPCKTNWPLPTPLQNGWQNGDASPPLTCSRYGSKAGTSTFTAQTRRL